MKKIIASLVAASFALVSFQAFAQDASAPAAASTAKPKHKQLKTHGKKANVSEAASAAGTNDKGAPQ
jgi:Ni/Co efflux regulator RcnB